MSPKELEALTRRFATELEGDHRPRLRHPGARRRHERPDDGLDHGHRLDAPRLLGARRRHRQADRDRRLGRPRRRDRPGRRLHDRGRARAGSASSSTGARVAVQGFGNVGEATARLLHEAGARVVAITDVGGGVFDADGLDVPFLRRYLARSTARSPARPGTRPIDNDELFALDVDVLVLAALEGQITAANAGTRPRADPGRGAPTARSTPDADPILRAQRRRR